MNVGQLINGIVRQTTVLIAQVSTAAGLRAPLSHVADQVFYELAREIESQGVGRKVVADMFGLALRTYQKKIQRLSESRTAPDQTLWEAVLGFIRERGPVSRGRIEKRFHRDPKPELAAVLRDLVNGGLVYSTGRGASALFGITSEADQATLAASRDAEALAHLVWMTVYRRRSILISELIDELNVEEAEIRRALDGLIADGRVILDRQEDGETLRAPRLIIPVGAEQGWEAAVFDHYTAVCAAIVSKLRIGSTRSQGSDVVGGATLRFDVAPGHPFEGEVYALLPKVRRELNELWNRVSEYNREHPIEPSSRTSRVTFYFGQYVEDPPEEPRSQDDEVQT